MSKEPKEPREPKHRVEGLRQPQRKDSLSSVLSWAGLQAKPSPPRTPTSSSSTSPQSSQSSPAQDISKSRRHSHGPEAKTKARRTSTTSRRFSLSNPTGTEEDSSTKTKRAKTASTLVDSKSPSDGSSRTTRNGSADKINKLAQEAPDARKKASKQQLTAVTSRDKSSSQPERPISPKPKGILRISSPDGSRPPRHIASFPAPIPTPTPAPAPAPAPNPDLGQQPDSPEPPPLSPLQPDVPSTTPDTTPISPPTSPISRPLSPGATVRFAKATIHRVEVGPGRRFIPVKRKSKSTITYIAPLDPGTQKSAPKGMLGSPTKLRRHQENQAAMGRYWLRTEEEEAQWRADAERRAVEEAEKYRAEPSSPPPSSVLARSPIGVPVPGIQSLSFAERVSELEKLPSVENLPALDKLEIEEAESEDEEATETPGMGALLADEEDPEPTTTTAADEWPDEAPVEVIGLGIEEAVQPRSEKERGETGQSKAMEQILDTMPDVDTIKQIGAPAVTQQKATTSAPSNIPTDRPSPAEAARQTHTQTQTQTQTHIQGQQKQTEKSQRPPSRGAQQVQQPRTETTTGSQTKQQATTDKRPEASLTPVRSKPQPTISIVETTRERSRSERGGGGGGGGGSEKSSPTKANHLHLSRRRSRRSLFDEHDNHGITA